MTKYKKSDTANYVHVGKTWVPSRIYPGLYDASRARGFLKFDLSSLGITTSQVVSAKLKIYVNYVYGGGGYYILESDSGTNNWGSTLDATYDDMTSTNTNNEGSKYISATGWVEYVVDKNNMDFSGWNYYRFRANHENAEVTRYIHFYSQDNGTNVPVLEITYSVGGRKKVVMVMAS